MRKDPNALAGIYAITRVSDGKVYIGQARKCSERWTMHRHSLNRGKHRNGPLQEAWNEGSADEDWTWEIICQPIGPNDPETMTYLEVEVLKTYSNTFNLMVPVQAYLGAHESTRAKLSAERLTRWADPAYKERVKASHAEKNADPEYRARHRGAMIEFHSTEEGRAIRKGAGAKSSKTWAENEAARKAQSERHSKLWADPEYREKQRLARTAAWKDPEKRQRRVDGLKRAWQESSPENREARVQAAATAQRRDEARKAQSERTKKRWDEGRGPRPRKAGKAKDQGDLF